MHQKSTEKDGVGDIPNNRDGDDGVTGGVERFLSSGTVCGHPPSLEQEKRFRREVANSNERRRMQSINAGFLTLRSMLPQREGEKLSKAAILQQTSDFICGLEQEKTRLLTQNCQLKRLLGQQSGAGSESPERDQASSSSATAADSPLPQPAVPRSASQEELTPCDAAHQPPPPPPPPAPQPPLQEPPASPRALRLELQELRAQLERERLQRLSAEEQLRQAEQRHQQRQQEQQEQQHVHMRFKKPRLEPVASPQLLMTEQHVLAAPEPEPEEPLHQPPPPPVTNRRPLYLGSTTSRQNLDTIVEAIRHLEGDHLFGDCSEPAPSCLEPPPVRVETMQTRLEPVQTCLEPIQARLEPVHTHVEPVHTRLEPVQARFDPIQTRLEPLRDHLELQQPSCLELEPQDAPLELTTHARSVSSSVDPYRPAVIVSQHPAAPRR